MSEKENNKPNGMDVNGLHWLYASMEKAVLEEPDAMIAFQLIIDWPKPKDLGRHETTLAKVTLLAAMTMVNPEYAQVTIENAEELKAKLIQAGKEKKDGLILVPNSKGS